MVRVVNNFDSGFKFYTSDMKMYEDNGFKFYTSGMKTYEDNGFKFYTQYGSIKTQSKCFVSL